ncbi:hypothetical protein B0H15DRAFT_244639 [Mycena belliarum]|uniref:Secreted protein n=1 Tax=Mycena belliarum TaxID=1033014 RepID=A0AAD6XSV5_9AGAR|nr:hypothetical protein B0H15DRAFT_244639 [Mycena belliae]
MAHKRRTSYHGWLRRRTRTVLLCARLLLLGDARQMPAVWRSNRYCLKVPLKSPIVPRTLGLHGPEKHRNSRQRRPYGSPPVTR